MPLYHDSGAAMLARPPTIPGQCSEDDMTTANATTTRVELETKTGRKVSGELAVPAGAGKAPAVVLIQEWWGLDDHIRSLLGRLAAEGFVALAPDLYHGKVTKDPEEAGKL